MDGRTYVCIYVYVCVNVCTCICTLRQRRLTTPSGSMYTEVMHPKSSFHALLRSMKRLMCVVKECCSWRASSRQPELFASPRSKTGCGPSDRSVGSSDSSKEYSDLRARVVCLSGSSIVKNG